MVLVDTSVIIDYLRQTKSDHRNKSLFINLVNTNHELAISIVTHTELFAGKSVWDKPQAKQDLKLVLTGLDVIPLNLNISKKAGRIAATHKTGIIDAIIAATAVENKIELVTLNAKHFSDIKNLHLRPSR